MLSFLLFATVVTKSQNLYYDFIPPYPVSSISMAYSPSTQTFYFHSGLSSDGTYHLGIQRFYKDSAQGLWRFTEQQGNNFPDSRSFYGSFFSQNQFYYIFGGVGEMGMYNDMWKYDTKYNVWTAISENQPISPRYSFAYTSFSSNDYQYFVVLGGKGNTRQASLLDFTY
ncbi:hypothetical protein SteCoe_28969 [Stentor coeruleus]|uniref:Uncharacterized protein n=1 Tax=Stentor coeruleus TaxID=5963 RepID=A0A1R2B6W9_9CILI|nr:hypothetical protein SteCoe_28969 [Stentor coeruleus]